MNILTASVGKDGGIVSNYAQVQKALEDYVKVRNQSVYDSVKEKMANIAFKAAQNTDFAPRATIKAKLLSLPITKDNGRKRTGNTQYVGLYKLINWQRKNMGLDPLGNSRVRKVRVLASRGPSASTKIVKKQNIPRNTGPSQGVSRFMDGKSKPFVQARMRGSMFLKIGWAAAAAALGKPFEKGDFGSATIQRLTGKAYGGGANITNLAPGSNRFEIYNGAGVFDLRYKGTPMRSSNDIARAREKQKAGLMKGVAAEIASIYKIVIERNSQAWFGKKIKVKAI